jgi:hypothetical protein
VTQPVISEKTIGEAKGVYTFMTADEISKAKRSLGFTGVSGVNYVLNTFPYTKYRWSSFWGKLVKA